MNVSQLQRETEQADPYSKLIFSKLKGQLKPAFMMTINARKPFDQAKLIFEFN
jgi:hypothetical protein